MLERINKPKTDKEILNDALKMSFGKEVENDIYQIETLLKRPQEVSKFAKSYKDTDAFYSMDEFTDVLKEQKEKLKDKYLTQKEKNGIQLNIKNLENSINAIEYGPAKIAEQEYQSTEIIKRALITVASSNMQVVDSYGNTKKASENNLPVASYLSHGGRVNIEIPPGSGNDFFNWLTSGNKDISGISNATNQNAALKEGKVVYRRLAATHGTEVKEITNNKGEKEYSVKETQGLSIGATDTIKNLITGARNTKHFGVDLSIGAGFAQPDLHGEILIKPDGEHGHLYMHYLPPTKNKPGSILIGIEGAAPDSPNHSIFGASLTVSAVGSTKFRDMEGKQAVACEKEYINTLVPGKYNSMNIKLDSTNLNNLVDEDSKQYGPELASIIPCDTIEEFKNKMQNQEFHQPPEKFVEFEGLMKKEPPHPWFKEAINSVIVAISIGRLRPFEKDIEDYRNQKEIYQKQQQEIRAYKQERITEKSKHASKEPQPQELVKDTKDNTHNISSVNLNTEIENPKKPQEESKDNGIQEISNIKEGSNNMSKVSKQTTFQEPKENTQPKIKARSNMVKASNFVKKLKFLNDFQSISAKETIDPNTITVAQVNKALEVQQNTFKDPIRNSSGQNLTEQKITLESNSNNQIQKTDDTNINIEKVSSLKKMEEFISNNSNKAPIATNMTSKMIASSNNKHTRN